MSTELNRGSLTWGAMGDSILVTDQGKFSREVLPRYFKHDNIRSFIRQLNIYGFQRCRNPERAGSVEGEHGELEFFHEHLVAQSFALFAHHVWHGGGGDGGNCWCSGGVVRSPAATDAIAAASRA